MRIASMDEAGFSLAQPMAQTLLPVGMFVIVCTIGC